MSTAPADLAPMKAVTGELPGGEGWAFEVKWDGMRLLAWCDPAGDPALVLRTTRGHDAAARFPELAGLPAAVGCPVVLDGEAVVLDDQGRSDFGRLQTRMHVAGPAAVAEAAAAPVTFIAFDLLWLDDNDVTGLPYLDRRRLLAEVVEPGPAWLVPGHVIGGGQALYDEAVARGLEGLVAKRVESPYLVGRRSPSWRKVKVRCRQELVVGGWLPGEGNRSGTLGALLVGYHDDTGLRYAGRVGTGFSVAELDRLARRLDERTRLRSPFVDEVPAAVRRRAHWADPVLVVEVEFGEWTADGRLRHPSYAGERTDKDPATVRREAP